MSFNTVDMGATYRLSQEWQLGGMVKNMIGFALNDKYRGFELPRYLTLGVSRHWNGVIFALDSEYIWGDFGGSQKKTIDVWLLRAGVEKRLYPGLTGRAGLICPLSARTSTLGDLRDDIPSPKVAPTLGISLHHKNWQMDISLHGDPASSYIKQKPTVASALSLIYRF